MFRKALLNTRKVAFSRGSFRHLASNSNPHTPAKKTYSGYLAVVTAFGAGIALGAAAIDGRFGSFSSSPDLTSLSNRKPNSAGPDPSTAPVDTLTVPQYANDEDFKVALEKINSIVGLENTSTDEDTIQAHADTFYSTHHPPKSSHKPHTVVYPGNTEQVSEILKVAHEYRVPIVATSGLTALEGQNMHTRGPNSISLNFGRLDQVLAFHPDDLDVVVQAGVGWQELDTFLLNEPTGKHLFFGPDPGMGATIAGMVSTSASGTNAYKYGTMKENVINLTVVLADGTIVKTKQRPRKTSAGYDITRLFIGAEGTLGIITEITVKLHVRPVKELVSIASFPTIKDAASTAQEILTRSGLQPNAIEILDSTMVSFVNDAQAAGSKKFLECPTLFFKLGGSTQKTIDDQISLITKIAKKNNLITFESSHDEAENTILWYARRNGLWSTVQFGAKILEDPNDVQLWTTDIAVPLSKLSQVISETNDDLVKSGFDKKFSVMGHIGDGNCHFLLLYNSPDYAKAQAVVDRMVERAISHEGTCTGEHGVGVGKRRYLESELGKTTVDLMRQIKLSLDPRRILNPDKIIVIDPEDGLDALLDKGVVKEVAGCCH